MSGASADELVGGAVVHLARGAPVAVANLGVEALRLLVVLAPAGFERAFLGWQPAADAPAADPGGRHALLDLTRLPRRQRHRTVTEGAIPIGPSAPAS